MSTTNLANAGRSARRSSRRRFWIISLFAVAGLAGILAFLINRAPDYLARYLVRNYFQGLNIDTSGVETIDIDPLSGEINFGPVSFRGGDAEEGQLGRIGLKFDVRQLLQKRALLQSVVIEGIRLDIRQSSEDGFFINGVPLSRIVAERAAQAAPSGGEAAAPAPAAPDVRTWHAGLNSMRLRDSRIVFTDPRGGKATIEVNELDLDGFLTWAPDDPGKFRLDGDLNRIHIAASGAATPFADNIKVDAALAVTGIEPAKIETYTGPLGLSPNAGRIDLAIETKGAQIFPDGRIAASLSGKADLSAIDLAHSKFGSMQLDAGTLQADSLRLLYDADGTVEIDGNAAVDLETMALRLNDGTEVAFSGAGIKLPALRAHLSPSGPPTIKLTPQLDVRSLRLGGRYVQGTAETVAIQLSAFDVDTASPGTPFIATGSVDVAGLALLLPLKKPIKIGASSIDLDLAEMRFAFQPKRTEIAGGLGIEAVALNFAVTKRGGAAGALLPLVEIVAGKLTGGLSPLAVDDAMGATKVKVASPSLALDRFRLGAPVAPGEDLNVSASTLQLRSADIDVADGATLNVSGRSVVASPRLSVSVGETGRSGTGTDISLAGFAFDPRRFAYRENGPNSNFAFQGRINAERIDARLPSGVEQMRAAVDFGALRLNADDLAMDIDNPAPQWHARGLDLSIKSMDAAVPGSIETALTINDINLVDGVAASRGEYGFERLGIGRIDASLTRQRPATGATVADTRKPGPKTQKAAARSWPPKDLPLIHIGRLGLLDGAKIVVIDRTVTPPASSTVQIDAFAIENVATANPAARSDVRIKARLDQAELTADGWALPFQPKPDFDLRARVDELVLPSINPYVGPAIGLDVVEGKLVADAEARADAGQLKGEIRAKVIDLGFADRPEAGRDRISRSIGVPLSTIIDLLQDADGSIDLTLPFEGDLLSPEFDYSDVIWSGIFRVLRALIVSPFKLISASVSLLKATRDDAGQDSGESASAAPQLAPVPFAPAQDTLGPEARNAMAAMQQVLQARPKLRLRLCGTATRQDQEALLDRAQAVARKGAALPDPAPQMRLLAEARMRAVGTALSADGGISPSQVQYCPELSIDPADTGLPRVDIGF